MNFLTKTVFLFLQIFAAFALSFSVIMTYSVLSYSGGIDGFIGMLVFQPLYAFLLTVIGVFSCFLIGLPIRLNKKIKSWFREHFYIAFLSLGFGVLLCIASFFPEYSTTFNETWDTTSLKVIVPNITFALAGWLLIIFGTLHVYPPLNFFPKLLNN